jgi:putative colanic acid biosynthesis UDP-glucose lipid carrier transferase
MASHGHYLLYSLVIVGALILDRLRVPDEKLDLIRPDFIAACRVSFRQVITILFVLLAFLVAARDLAISRFFLLTYTPLLLTLLFYTNTILPRFVAKFAFSGTHEHRTLLVGSPAQVRRMASWFERKSMFGYRTVGIITEEPTEETEVYGTPILGRAENIEDHIVATNATQLLSLGLLPADEVHRLSDICHLNGVRFLLANDLQTTLGRKVNVLNDDGIQFIGFLKEPLECPFNRIVKRILDLVIALPVVLFVLPPIALVVYLLQRLQSPGPLLFRQARTGIKGNPFKIYKFRTMHLHNRSEAEQATKNDPRVFPAGRWMRKLSIDELPQFINVLKGEMSVVGPRPHLREHDQRFTKAMKSYPIRAFIKPGITGLAQVRDLRGETKSDQDVIERVESDIYYLENWSLSLDTGIVLRTIAKVLFPAKTSY